MEVPINETFAGIPSGTGSNFNSIYAQEILAEYGMNLGDFNIMHVMPSELEWNGAAAWGQKPGTVTAFRDQYADHVHIQVHEVGHNFGFGHSGFDGDGYGDHSCSMGGGQAASDDGPAMCFNGVKSFYTDW